MASAESYREARVLLITEDGSFSALLQSIAIASGWTFESVRTVQDGTAALGADSQRLVVYDWDTSRDDWREALDTLALLPGKPCILLSSPVVDEYLREEVMRYHGYDVLPRSGDRDEIIRTVSFAWFWAQLGGKDRDMRRDGQK